MKRLKKCKTINLKEYDLFESNILTSGWLTGKLLIAMPSMPDPRFHQSVIYICVHNEDGAMGITINNKDDTMRFADVMVQIGVDIPKENDITIPVYNGGPVESGRGFVLHTLDWGDHSTIDVGSEFGLTATIDVLEDMSQNKGPTRSLLALGYAGWNAGQLEQEIQTNGWLTADADTDIVFSQDAATKWHRSLDKLGISPNFLSIDAGSA